VNTHIDKKSLNLEQVAIASNMLKLISDPARLKILWALLHGEHSVGELAEHINAQPAAVSQHLAKLRIGYLVKVRRDGNRMMYSTDNAHVHTLIEQALSHADHITKRNK
jgi:DNA-binding transcriptional ArsR family regulator